MSGVWALSPPAAEGTAVARPALVLSPPDASWRASLRGSTLVHHVRLRQGADCWLYTLPDRRGCRRCVLTDTDTAGPSSSDSTRTAHTFLRALVRACEPVTNTTTATTQPNNNNTHDRSMRPSSTNGLVTQDHQPQPMTMSGPPPPAPTNNNNPPPANNLFLPLVPLSNTEQAINGTSKAKTLKQEVVTFSERDRLKRTWAVRYRRWLRKEPGVKWLVFVWKSHEYLASGDEPFLIPSNLYELKNNNDAAARELWGDGDFVGDAEFWSARLLTDAIYPPTQGKQAEWKYRSLVQAQAEDEA